MAAFLYVPGFLLYISYRRKWKQVLRDKYTWLGIFGVLAIAGSWIVIQISYGVHTLPSESRFGSRNILEVLFWQDAVVRFSDTGFDHSQYIPDHFFVIIDTDVFYNIWSYFFYLTVVAGIIIAYKRRNEFRKWVSNKKPGVMFSILMAAPICIFLTVSVGKHYWYLAPIWGFVAQITATGIIYFSRQRKWFVIITSVVGLLLLCRHFNDVNTLSASLHQNFKNHQTELQHCDSIFYLGTPPQHIFLYTQWQGKPMRQIPTCEEAATHRGQLLLLADYELHNCNNAWLKPVMKIKPGYIIAKIVN